MIFPDTLQGILDFCEAGGQPCDSLKKLVVCDPSDPSAMIRLCPPNPPTTDHGSWGGQRGKTNEEGLPIAIPRERAREEAKELYAHWIVVLERLAGGIHPSPQRVKQEPSDRVIRILKKALQDATLAECKRAIEGAYVHWASMAQGGHSITDVFTTFKGTGDLPSRIAWFAALSASPPDDAPKNRMGLDAPGVRDRIHDVRREVRAALDLPDSASHQRRAAASEQWLWSKGLMIVRTSNGRFEIVAFADTPQAVFA